MEGTCTEKGCPKPVTSRGLCSAHYQKARYHKELPETPERACENCKTSFTPAHWDTRYCSPKCKRAAQPARSQVAARACETCGTTFTPRRTARYCSLQCYREAERLAKRAARGGYRCFTCEWCGKDLPPDRRNDIRFCSDKCGQDSRNARLAAERLAAKAQMNRRCLVCDEPIAPERSGKIIYCSRTCKSRARRHEAYGLTREELRLLLAQHDRCAICGNEGWGKKGPQVDHCHATGRVRGILCLNCNNGLGRFADDPVRLRAAADYLEKSLALAGRGR